MLQEARVIAARLVGTSHLMSYNVCLHEEEVAGAVFKVTTMLESVKLNHACKDDETIKYFTVLFKVLVQLCYLFLS